MIRIKIGLVGLFALFLLNVDVVAAQDVVLDGALQLKDQIDHSAIEVVFKKIAPEPVGQTSALTNSNGHFSITLPAGIYEITYKKSGYFSVFLGQLDCFSSKTLVSKTLFKRSSVINVPYHFALIQHAIDDSFAGDTILLEPLTYFESINLKGKEVLITSHSVYFKDKYNLKNTIIDGGNTKSVVVCDHFETNKTILSGFTIRNGNAVGDYPDYFGGGIRCINSSPSLDDLVIENNHAQYGGGGIFMIGSQSVITNVRIINNTADNDGGGIRITSSSPTIKNCIIASNTALIGGGVTCNFFNTVGSTQIMNSTIAYNKVTSTSESDFSGGAGMKITGANLALKNSILAFNEGDYGVSFFDQALADYPVLSYNAFHENGTGNFYKCNPLNGPIATQNINQDPVDAYFNVYANPEFTDPVKYNFGLTITSHSVDAGNNLLIDLAKDIDYADRIQNDNDLNEAHVNLGAIESVSGAVPVFVDDQRTICNSDPVTFEITSAGDQFRWSMSEEDEGILFESGKVVVIDTIRTSMVLYVANADYSLLSPKTPVTITVLEKPDFTIEASPVTSVSYQVSASPTVGIETYSWTVSDTDLESDAASPTFEFQDSGNYEVCLLASNAGCEVEKCEAFDFLITGLSEDTAADEYEFFPNPASSQCQVKSKNGINFSLLMVNPAGKTIHAAEGNAQYEISLTNKADGVYFLIVKPANGTGQQRVYKIIKTGE